MDKVAVLAAHGIQRPAEMVELASKTGLEVAAAATILEKESSGGHNVWGHDAVKTAGTYVKGAVVTKDAYLAYRDAVHAGKAGRQGVGPTQLTFGGFQDEADHLGGSWDWRCNVTVGFRILAKGIKSGGTRKGFRAYNGSGPAAERYADDAMKRYHAWRNRLAGAPVAGPVRETSPGAPSPGAPSSAPPAQFPADVVNLRPWKLTLPEKGKVKGNKIEAKEIEQPALATFANEFFALTDDKTGIRFRCHHGGFTTNHSDNPRSELREMNPNGSTLAKWATDEGRHTLTVRGQVNRLTHVRPHVVIAQIHDNKRGHRSAHDLTVFRVEGRKLFVTNDNNPHAHLVTDTLALGDPYEIGFDVSNGVVNYFFNGQKLDFSLAVKDKSCYFKAGNYLQSNEQTAPDEVTSEFAEVVISTLTVTHAA